MAITLRISEILEEQGINVSEFSRRAGVVYRTALDLKKGSTRRIDLETIDKVCNALNVEPADLFEYKPNKK